MATRQEILEAIQRLAEANDGAPPGQSSFAAATGITEHMWRRKYWVRWSEALLEAGYHPNPFNRRREPNEILDGVVEACRHFGRFPTFDELSLYRSKENRLPTVRGILNHFTNRASLLRALRLHVKGRDDCLDIARMLDDQPVDSTGRDADGYVYLVDEGTRHLILTEKELEALRREITVAELHAIRTDDPEGIANYWRSRFHRTRERDKCLSLTSREIAAFRKRRFQ